MEFLKYEEGGAVASTSSTYVRRRQSALLMVGAVALALTGSMALVGCDSSDEPADSSDAEGVNESATGESSSEEGGDEGGSTVDDLPGSDTAQVSDVDGVSGGEEDSSSDTSTDDVISAHPIEAAETVAAALGDCASAGEQSDIIVCAVEAFLTGLSEDEQSTVRYDYNDSINKTCWSNLPGQNRPGITLGALDDEDRIAAMVVAYTVMSPEGFEDFRGLLAADDYLAAAGGMGGGPGGPSMFGGGPPGFDDGGVPDDFAGPPAADGGAANGFGGGAPTDMGVGGGFAYGSENAHVAIFGTPSTTDDWMLSIGNHHMAYNVTFLAGEGHPTPNHLGAEPRADFSIDSETYSPLSSEGEAFLSLFKAMDAETQQAAHLSGTFNDIVLGPDEYCTGEYSNVVFPEGDARGGVLVGDLSEELQGKVTAAIEEWVADYQPAIADALLAEYTSAESYADTYVGWGGSALDVAQSGTYFRVDGPRAWIELACQSGAVLTGTHYHTVYRDRGYDYGGALQ